MTGAVTLRYLLMAMATYGDNLGRTPDPAAETASRRGSRRGVAGEMPTGLPAPVVPPPMLPARTFAPPPRSALPAPPPAGAPVAAQPGSPPPSQAAGGPGAPNSLADIRAVHEATTRQLRERRTNGNGPAVIVACGVVVIGGIAFVLGSLLL